MADKYEAVLKVFETINGEVLRHVSTLRLSYSDGYETMNQCWESVTRFAGMLQERGVGDAFEMSCHAIGG